MRELAHFPAVAAAAALAITSCMAAAPAQALVVPIAGSGLVTPRAGFNPFASPWPLEGLPEFSVYAVDGEAGWTLSSSFDVVIDFSLGFPRPGNGHGSFRFAGPMPGDAIEGSFNSVFDASNGNFGGYDLTYQVTSGAGRYLGLTGNGSSETVFTSDPGGGFPVSFDDAGRLVLLDSPDALALAALALAAAGATRRRAASQGNGDQGDTLARSAASYKAA